VLVLDLNMPGPPLLEVVADLRARLPALQIVVLTAHDGAAQARTDASEVRRCTLLWGIADGVKPALPMVRRRPSRS